MTVIEQEAVETLIEPDPLLMHALAVVRSGWCQDSYSGRHGGRCLVGALIDATYPTTMEMNVHSVVTRLGFADVSEAIVWNDKVGRTKKEVEELLERKAYGL